jgi:hypothetical protein
VTTATSVTAPAAGYVPPRTLDQQLQQDNLPDTDYYLQCEFVFTGCAESFHPFHYELWINHTFEHLTRDDISPPLKAVCIFCDMKFDCSETLNDPIDNWRERMDHIHLHFQEGASAETARPDFFVVNHMRAHGLITRVVHDHLMTYTERPFVDGLQPLGWESEEKKKKREKDLTQEHNLEKEKRLQKRMAARTKGKGT